jgi:hypothetical protein
MKFGSLCDWIYQECAKDAGNCDNSAQSTLLTLEMET